MEREISYLKELAEQFMNLYDELPTKVNIHFNVSSPLFDLCMKINQDINRHALGFINFGIREIAIPHISIYMGYVNSFEQLEDVIESVGKYADTHSIFQIDPVRLYFKGVSRFAPQYLFLDMLQNDFLYKQKELMFNQFANQLSPIEWDMLNETPHITLGCYKNVTGSAMKAVEKYKDFPICTINQIGVSLCGRRGVCLSNIKTFDLTGNA